MIENMIKGAQRHFTELTWADDIIDSAVARCIFKYDQIKNLKKSYVCNTKKCEDVAKTSKKQMTFFNFAKQWT